jgi:transposase
LETDGGRLTPTLPGWLFAGNDAAAENHARLYTLIAGAERHGIDPQKYLTSVLAKIGHTPLSELEQFLPEVWKDAAITEAHRP